MSFLSRLFGKKIKKEAKIVLLGASGAGKTTLVRYLETGQAVEQDAKTTLGIDIRKTPIKVDGWSFKAIDVGGQELYQKTFWSLGVSQSDAVIYVIDGTTKPDAEDDKFETSLFQFEYALGIVDEDTPLLILINKQDLTEQNPVSTEDGMKLYGMDQLTGRSMIVLPSSAKYGDGVDTAMEWLVDKVNEKLNA